MDDRMWTTEDAETISDDDARTLLQEQLRRQLAEISRAAADRERRERGTATEVAVDWGRQVARARDERARRIRAEYPEPPRSEIHEESWTEKARPAKKKDTILKPLPDELFEID